MNLTQLKSDFGTYIATNQKTILNSLLAKTVSMKHMRTIASKDLEWRAAQAVIDDLVQGFQKAWTPKGTPTFTPIAIPQRRHKFDLEFYPDDIFESWLGFLADESKTRKEWPITKYVIEKLVLPKIADNRELKLIGTGRYEAVEADVAQATGKSMDGFVTILEDLHSAGTSNVNFFESGEEGWIGELTDSNIVDFIEAFVDWIDELYQGVKMPVFMSNRLLRVYRRKYRDAYGTDTDFNGKTNVINEASNNPIVGLPSMAGKNVIFTTPKDNFIRLRNSNEGASNIEVEAIDRLVKVFGDWHESVGFAMEEAIFAHIPSEASGSTSVSSSVSPT